VRRAHSLPFSPQLTDSLHTCMQSCEATSHDSGGAPGSVPRAKTPYGDQSHSNMPTKRKLSCMYGLPHNHHHHHAPLLSPSSPLGLSFECLCKLTTSMQVCVFQEIRLLLDRMHILARRVPRPRTRIPEGPRGGAAQRDHRYHPLRRGVRGEGRGSRDSEDSAYVLLIAHFLPHPHH
jgi:hypothetical protein